MKAKKRNPQRAKHPFSRRHFLWMILAVASGLLARMFDKINILFKRQPDFVFLRPPGAIDEADFLSICIRCRACANVCEAGCIKFFSIWESTALAGTPYIKARQKSCNLCMNCNHICPTGALTTIAKNMETIKEQVDMGLAVVKESLCISYNGRICGICRDACPLKGNALKLKPIAKPVVDENYCIGCGRCEERCPQYPAAIRVYREAGTYAKA